MFFAIRQDLNLDEQGGASQLIRHSLADWVVYRVCRSRLNPWFPDWHCDPSQALVRESVVTACPYRQFSLCSLYYIQCAADCCQHLPAKGKNKFFFFSRFSEHWLQYWPISQTISALKWEPEKNSHFFRVRYIKFVIQWIDFSFESFIRLKIENRFHTRNTCTQ